MKKIEEILGKMEYKDLLILKKEFDSGSFFLQNNLNKKISMVENTHRKSCASCGKEVNLDVDDIYTLMFGEQTIRKKASFCGMDCLREFLTLIDDKKNESLRKEVE